MSIGLGLGLYPRFGSASKYPYLTPNTTRTFPEVLAGTESKDAYETIYDFVFGTDVVPTAGQIKIGSISDLERYFEEYSKFNGANFISVINDEVQRYARFSDTASFVFGTSDLKLTANLKNNVIEPKLITRNPASNVTYSRTVPLADTSGLVVGQVAGFGPTVGPGNMHTTYSLAVRGTVASGDTATITFTDANAAFGPIVITLTAGGADTPDTFADAFVTAINADATLSANNVLAYRATGCTGAFIITAPRNSASAPNEFGSAGKTSLRWLSVVPTKTGTITEFAVRTRMFATFITAIDPGVSVTLSHPVTVTTAQPVTFSPVQFVIQKSDSYNSATVPVTETSAVTVGQLCFLGYQDNNLRRVTAINPGVSITLNANVWLSAGAIWAFYPAFSTTANAASSGTTVSMAAVPAGVEVGHQFVVYYAADKLGFPIYVTGKTANSVTLDTAITVTNGATLFFLPPISSGQFWTRRTFRPKRDDSDMLAFELTATAPPQSALGGWPAFWTYINAKDPNVLSAESQGVPEIDFMDTFGWWNNDSFMDVRSGQTTTTSTPYNVTTTGNNIGLAKRKIQGIWSKSACWYYTDDVPKVARTGVWGKKYGSQLGVNLACGATSTANNSQGLFPIDFSQFPMPFTIERLRVLRARVASLETRDKHIVLCNKELPAAVTFSRSTTGTDFVNGSLVSSAVNGARISDQNGLLIEPQRTNLQRYSMPTSGFYFPSNVSVALNDATILGQSGFCKITASGSGQHYYLPGETASFTITSGNIYTISCVVKAGTTSRIQLSMIGSLFTNAYANFYLTGDGSVTAQGAGALSTSIVKLADSVYRISITGTATSTGSARSASVLSFIQSGTDGSAPSFASAGESVWFGMSQSVQAFGVSSYIPTTTAAVTRSEDVVSLTTPGNIPYSSGTVRLLFKMPNERNASGSNPVVLTATNAAGETLSVAIEASTGKLLITSTGLVDNASLLSASALTAGSVVCVAFKWGTNNWSMSVNGAAVVTDTTVSAFASAFTSVVFDPSLNSYLYEFKVWPDSKTDYELTVMAE